jgi:hypothetical protein
LGIAPAWGSRCWFDFRLAGREQFFDETKETAWAGLRISTRAACWTWLGNWGRLAWSNAFDCSFRAGFNIAFLAAHYGIGFEFARSFFGHNVTGFLIV